MRIYFITSNKGKYEEVQKILTGDSVVQKKIDYPEIQAGGLDEVVRFGMDTLCNEVREQFMIEDSGLFVDALEGFPGVYSAYVYHCLGNQGILKLMEKQSNRRAVFRSVIGYCDKKNEIRVFRGICKGNISRVAKGQEGFGFDPIFIPEGSTLTFAQMDKKTKNKYSHRGKSVRALNKYLEKK